MKFRTKNIPISEIRHNTGQIPGVPKNPRLIKDAKYRTLIRSIQDEPEMLNLREIIVYPHESTYVAIAGNMRLTACQELKYKDVSCKILPADTPPEKLKAYIIKDNIPYGEFDFELLKLDDWDIGTIEDWGLDVPELDLGGGGSDGKDAEPQVDRAKELNEKWQVKVGDLFSIGNHRLLCGDSTKKENVERLMGGEKADIVFTSPPYNLKENIRLSTRKRKTNAYIDYQDNQTDKDYLFLLKQFTILFLDYCQYAIVNLQSLAGNKTVVIDYQYLFKNHFADTVIWYKSNPQPAMAEKVMNSAFEYFFILSSSKEPSRAIKTATFHGTFSNVYKGTVNSENIIPESHSATFALSLAIDFIKNFSNKDVIDPFLGSGTTMVACENLKRRCFGMELSPDYCAVILERMTAAFPDMKVNKL